MQNDDAHKEEECIDEPRQSQNNYREVKMIFYALKQKENVEKGISGN